MPSGPAVRGFLPDGDGAEVCRRLRERLPELRCMILTSFADADALAAAVAAGAAGFLLKQVRGPALVSAVHTVAAGGTFFDEVPGGTGAPAQRAAAQQRLGLLT